MEENLPGSAATDGGGMGIGDTTLIELVDTSSFLAAGDRLLVRLNSSCVLHILDVPGHPQKNLMFLWKS